MNIPFIKNEIVTVISVQGNFIIIENTKVLSCGIKRIMFECFDGFFETPTITPTIESIEERVYCFNCVAPNEDFIKRYIEVAKKQRLNNRERVKVNLEKNLVHSRFKRHFELFKEDLTVKDLRKKII
jgi:hypothetical protein